MILQLKHILPYLPYGLRCEILNYKSDYVGIQKSTVDGYYFIGSQLHLKYVGGSVGKVVGKEMVLYLKSFNIGDIDIIALASGDYCDAWAEWIEHIDDLIEQPEGARILACPYDLMQLLLEEHYDMFGLIEAGSAVDIKTLGK